MNDAPLPLPAEEGHVVAERVGLELGEGPQRFEVLRDVSLRAAPGEFVCLVGPSGCGKSTLLGAIAGHLRVARGRLSLDGRPITGPDPQRGLVFQHHTLFPWMTVLDNVAYGLKMMGVAKAERQARAHELIGLVGLAGFEGRYPRELSGGMQQRVEIARVLANRPRVLLMDEPFGALDALTRARMQSLLLDLWSRIRTTVLFITHDIDEALFLADRVLVMGPRPGAIIDEIAVPFERPRDAGLTTRADFVALKRHCLAQFRHDGSSSPLERLTPLGAPPATTYRYAV